MTSAVDPSEKNLLKMQLAFVPNVHPDILGEIEGLISASDADATDPLILSYGALASKSAPELMKQVVQYLQGRVEPDNQITLVHLVHALGNTKSSLVDKTLLPLIEHDNPSVRAAAVYALRHRLQSTDVQKALTEALRVNRHDSAFTAMVVRSLVAGAESAQLSAAKDEVEDALIEELLSHAGLRQRRY